MAEPKEESFLDDIEDAAAEEQALADAESGAEPDAPSEIDVLRAERDALQDRFMRALADAENARKLAVRAGHAAGA
jgi:molecular chaperone GrpE